MMIAQIHLDLLFHNNNNNNNKSWKKKKKRKDRDTYDTDIDMVKWCVCARISQQLDVHV